MYKRYNIQNLVTSMEIEKTSPEYCRIERKRFGNFRHDLKSTVIKSYFFDGFFDTSGLSEEDMSYIMNGYSPIRTSPTGVEYTTFTIHHKKPLVCGGETRPSNLIPLPKNFHDFLHDKVFDPQIEGLKIGDKKVIQGVPDFSKITLPMMLDSGFIIQYHKYMFDTHHIMPRGIPKSDSQQLAHWYRKKFGNFM